MTEGDCSLAVRSVLNSGEVRQHLHARSESKRTRGSGIVVAGVYVTYIVGLTRSIFCTTTSVPTQNDI